MPHTMKITSIITFVLTSVFCHIYITTNNSIFLTLAISFGVTAYHFIMRLIVGYIVHSILHNKVNYNRKYFQPKKFETKLYKFLKVKKWKDKTWELGKLNGFSKSSIANPSDPAYIERFLVETNKGVTEHLVSILAGFTVIFCFPIKYVWIITFPIAMINLLLNYMSTMILRYNYPKLQTLYKRATRNQKVEIKKDTN